MIPLIASRYAFKVLPYVLLVLALAGGAWAFHHWAYARGKAVGDAIALEAGRERDVAIAALRASQEASAGYQHELQDLRSRPVPVRTVRLCTAAKPVPVSQPAARDHGGTASPGPIPAGPGPDPGEGGGPDIGPDLYELAARADRLAAQLRALQEWVKAVQAPQQ